MPLYKIRLIFLDKCTVLASRLYFSACLYPACLILSLRFKQAKNSPYATAEAIFIFEG